jgi:hypothetical protein
MSKYISKSLLPILRINIQRALNRALEDADPNLKATLGNIRFTPGANFTVKLTVTDVAAIAASVGGAVHGAFIPQKGDKVLNKGQIWTVVDYKPRNHKYPHIVERKNLRGFGVKRFKVGGDWFATATKIA